VKWRPRSNSQIWLAALTLTIATCIAATLVSAMREALPGTITGFAVTAWLATESRCQREEPEGLAKRLATLPPDDMPADVVSLVVAGKKIQAIKRYRDLTGLTLPEAKAVIDSL
jgi:ribosomal protein L7/L12